MSATRFSRGAQAVTLSLVCIVVGCYGPNKSKASKDLPPTRSEILDELSSRGYHIHHAQDLLRQNVSTQSFMSIENPHNLQNLFFPEQFNTVSSPHKRPLVADIVISQAKSQPVISSLKKLPGAGLVTSPVKKVKESLSLNRVPTADLLKQLKHYEEKIYRIYGDDNRADPHLAATNANLKAKPGWRAALELVDGVAALFEAKDVIDNHNGTFSLPTRSFAQAFRPLCSDEQYGAQPVGAFGTAFLVRSNFIVTAGHCVMGKDAPHTRDIRVVFGYRMLNEQIAVTVVPADDVYNLVDPIPANRRMYIKDVKGADWAIAQLTRSCGRRPLPVRNQGITPTNEDLLAIGYPVGLPVKIAGDSKLTSNYDPNSFEATLDVYAGNSGGPVISASGIVEGLVSAGGLDMIWNKTNDCFMSLRVPDTGVQGFLCTRASVFCRLLP